MKSDMWRIENAMKLIVDRKVETLRKELPMLMHGFTEGENISLKDKTMESGNSFGRRVGVMVAGKLQEAKDWVKTELKAFEVKYKNREENDAAKLLKDSENFSKKLKEAAAYIEANKEKMKMIERELDDFLEWKKESASKVLNLEASSKTYLNVQKFIWEKVKIACEKNVKVKDVVFRQFTQLATQLEINKQSIMAKINSVLGDLIAGNIHSRNEANNLDNKKNVYKLSLIHICRCRRYAVCRSRWSPYH
eukprot:TRINITY_DN17883_c0_g1_i1.p1 TRINITY_DN17883_c0_g1~~TRINITY_DN17883_c0_g1_i1.p1  ORF type:complete len:250 (-),score=65.83 TRINITY_DN17883_c0_g1_i1:15-764(-)